MPGDTGKASEKKKAVPTASVAESVEITPLGKDRGQLVIKTADGKRYGMPIGRIS